MVNATYLTLTLSGALGGILYSILLYGALELPSWGDGGKSLKLGFIGEVLVGISGAFTAYIFLPDALKKSDDREIIIFVAGLVGGYGGKAILNAALKRVINQINQANLVEKEKARLTEQVHQLNDDKVLIELVNRQINQGLPHSEIYELCEKIKNAPDDLKQQVFTIAKEIRRLSWRTKTFKSKIPRTIPIFEALVDSDSNNDQYHAQLAYAYKDSDPPRLDDAISHLNQAIQLRGTQILGNTWKYELNRAIAKILQEEQQTAHNSTASPSREEILQDLLSVDRNYGLAKVLIESEDEAVDIPLKGWLEKHQDWIRKRSGGPRLLEKAQVSRSQIPQPSGLTATVTPSKPAVEGDRRDTPPAKTTIKATEQTCLKKQSIQSSELPEDQKVEVPEGKEYKILRYSEASDGHYQVELDYDGGTWYIWSGHWHLPWEDNSEDDAELYQEFFTQANLKEIMPYASSTDIATYVKPLNKVLYDFDMATTARAAAFIAQVAHESGSLKYKEEIADGSAYEGRKDLGNTQPGDGKRYKGRGLIQLTGRYNYRTCGKALGLPLEDNPELVVKDPYTNAAVAGWYWKSRKINAAADAGDFEEVTRLINGGLNGYEDRCQFWERAKKVLSSPQSSSLPKSWREVNWNDFNAKVSKYFTVREVTNADRRRIPQSNDIKQSVFTLAQELDKVREAWGSPLLVNSWYRPPDINRAVGGASNSQHLYGKAADIRPAQGNIYDFQKWLDNVAWKDKAVGYGAKKGFVHVDLRPGRIRWNY